MSKPTLLLLMLLLCIVNSMSAQIGIGTTNPKALLHIQAKPDTPDDQKGIIIPTVSSLPTNNMGMEKKGMLVFLENGSTKGYYFYDGIQWIENDKAWRLDGNGGTNPNDGTNPDFIGTKDGVDLAFRVNNTETLRLTVDGTVVLPNTDIADIDLPNAVTTRAYVDKQIEDNAGGGVLEEVIKGSRIGYRIKGNSTNLNYVDMRNGAVDLSIIDTNHSDYSSSTKYGAKGEFSFAAGRNNRAYGNYSFAIGDNVNADVQGAIAMGYKTTSNGLYAAAMGYETEAQGYYSTALGLGTIAYSDSEVAVGRYNTSYSPNGISNFQSKDKAFVVGIGTGPEWNNRKDGFEVFKNGKIYADELEVSEITEDKQLVTKEYVDANGGGGVLEEITEGTNTGWRINGSTNAANFGDIGNNAVDLSTSTGTSATRGATGASSFATGENNVSSGVLSFTAGGDNSNLADASAVFGTSNQCSGLFSFIAGTENIVSRNYSFATGQNNTAASQKAFVSGTDNISRSFCEVVFGAYATEHNITGVNNSGVNAANRQFAIGNGTGTAARADAFEVFYDGTIYADALDIAEITDDHQLVTREYVHANSTDDQTASEVTYDNTTSGLTATDVQAAIDEVVDNEGNFISSVNEDTSNEIINFNKGIRISNLEYNSISTVSGGELIYDKNFWNDSGYGTGSGSPKDTFTNDGGGLVIYNEDDSWSAVFDTRNIKYANIDANNLKVQGNQVWHEGNLTSADVSYNNSTSGLSATNVQAAIDELASDSSSGGGSSGSINVGDEYLGGIVFHTWNNGTNGLIVSKVNLNDDDWGVNSIEIYSKGTALFSGEMNTILHKMEYPDGDYAGNQALAYSASFNGDSIGGWYLPSIDELELFLNVAYSNSTVKSALGFDTYIKSKEYWSSTEIDVKHVYISKIDHNGDITRGSSDKHSGRGVRVIKSF